MSKLIKDALARALTKAPKKRGKFRLIAMIGLMIFSGFFNSGIMPILAIDTASILEVPADFPGFPTAGYLSLGTDAGENGCSEHRNVLESYFQISSNQTGDDNFVFLRLRTEDPAGWPSDNSQGDARYKGFFDTINNDGDVSGNNIINYEYLLAVEDPTDNNNDGIGEIKFYNSADELIAGPIVASGSSAPSGPQTAYDDDFGYKIEGNYVDMYIRLSAIGNPNAFNVFWATDNENSNLNQSSNCDTPDSGAFISLPTFDLTVNGAGTGNGSVTDNGISCDIASGVASGDCDESYSAGTQVTLLATPVSGSTFDGWTGDCDVNGTVTMDASQACTAEFNLEAPATGNLTVNKVVNTDDGGTAVVSDFDLFVDATQVTSGETNSFPVGDYQITETNGPTGYAATFSGDCGLDGSITITQDADLTCTITNDDIAPLLTVTKIVDNDNGGSAQVGDFPLFVNDQSVTSGEQNSYSAGSYIVSETNLTGYVGVISGDCDVNGAISLNLGDVKSCVITNYDVAPGLTLIKVVTNDNDGTADETDFQAYIDGDPVYWGASQPLDAGTYELSESNLPGYEASEWSCDGGILEGNNVTIDVGETVICTIINDDIAIEPFTGSLCGLKFNDLDHDGQYNPNQTAASQTDYPIAGWDISLAQKFECSANDDWADTVVSFTQGLRNDGTPVVPERSDPTQALGIAQNDDTINFVALGFGGELILSFDNLIENGTGDDLQLVETSFGSPSCESYPERIMVSASQDGEVWETLGSGCLDSTFDLGALTWAKYVKLADISNPEDFTGQVDGYDVDGVRALHCMNAGEAQWTKTTEEGYCFEDLAAGQYMVCEQEREGWQNSTPLCQQITIEGGLEEEEVLFGNYELQPEPLNGSLCGLKYNDLDRNAEYNGEDYTLADWTINLYDMVPSAEGEEWADNVISYTRGSIYIQDYTGLAPEAIDYMNNAYSDPNQALGEVEAIIPPNFVLLGFAGELVLGFDNLIANEDGDDIEVTAAAVFAEGVCENWPLRVQVFASQDNINWIDLGQGCITDTFDLGALAWAKYLKFVDITDLQTLQDIFPDDVNTYFGGYTIDGVRALHSYSTSLIDTTDTTENGYCFNDLQPGLYTVCEVMQAGWENMTPLCQIINITNGADLTTDFGNSTLLPSGEYSVAKTLLTQGDIHPGDLIEYNILVENTGSVDITSLNIRDLFAAAEYLTFSNATVSPTDINTSSVFWLDQFSQADPLSVDETWTTNIYFWVKDDAQIGGWARNSVFLTQGQDANGHDLPITNDTVWFEVSSGPIAQCQDGLDNDGDGLIDFPADPGCASLEDNDETNGGGGGNGGSGGGGGYSGPINFGTPAPQVLGVQEFADCTEIGGYPAGSLLVQQGVIHATVYYISTDCQRYFFPDEKTYFTWYKDWSNVIKLDLEGLTAYANSGVAITYRPGSKLVKSPEAAQVYAVEPRGTLRPIPSLEIGASLFGSNWISKIQDLIPIYFNSSYNVSNENLSTVLPTGSLAKEADSSTVYYIENGAKRVFAGDMFSQNGFESQYILTADLSDYPEGTAIIQIENNIKNVLEGRDLE